MLETMKKKLKDFAHLTLMTIASAEGKVAPAEVRKTRK